MDFEPTLREKAIRKIEGSFLTYQKYHWHSVESSNKRCKAGTDVLAKKRKIYEDKHTLDNFRSLVYPVVEGIAQSDEEFEEVLSSAANCFSLILSRQLTQKGDVRENCFVEDFFRNGRFEYFYRRHGSQAVQCIASQQGSFLNMSSGDEIIDKVNTDEEVDIFWDRLKELPEQWREKVLKPSMFYFPEGIEKFFDAIPKVIAYFKEKGREDLLDYYFELCSETLVRSDFKADEHFPACDPAAVFDELADLSTVFEGFESEAVQLAKYVYSTCTVHPTFHEPSRDASGEVAEDGVKKFQIKVIRTGSDSKFDGSEEDVRRFLTFPMRHESLGRVNILLMLAHDIVTEAFPGGIEEAAAFIQEVRPYIHIQKDYYCQNLIGLLPNIPKNNKDFFFGLAKRVIKYLREDALPFLNFKCFSPKLKELYESDPEKFEEVIQEGMNLVFNLSLSAPRGSAIDSDVFEAYLLFYGDPRFEDFVEGLRKISYQAARACEKNLDNKYKDYPKIEKILNAYLAQCRVAGADGVAMLADSHYAAIAEASIMITLDDPADLPAREESKEVEVPVIKPGLKFSQAVAAFVAKGTDPYGVNMAMIWNVACCTEKVRADCDAVLRKDLEVIIEAAEEALDPNVSDHMKAIAARVNAEAHQAIDLSFWRENVVMAASRQGLSRVKDSWIYRAAPSTQLAATSGALFLALGMDFLSNDLHEFEDVPGGLIEELPLEKEFAAFAEGKIKMRELLESVKERGLEKQLRENIQRILPWVAEQIKSSRIALPGLMSVGTKIESAEGMSNEDFRFVLDLAGMGDVRTTPFTLKHNRRSLVNPPLPTALEEKLLIYFFMMFGAVDPNKIDMQVTVGGRLTGEMASVVGASSILSSYTSVQYASGAFEAPTFAGVESRIMVYDAGVRRLGLPFDLANVKGRTDRLGCHSLQDINQIQLLGTFAVHREFEGPFAAAMDTYKDAFERLLAEHRLLGKLRESAWVYEDAKNCDPPAYHEEMIRAFTVARRDNAALKNGTRRLMSEVLGGYLLQNRSKIIRDNPRDFERLSRT